MVIARVTPVAGNYAAQHCASFAFLRPAERDTKKMKALKQIAAEYLAEKYAGRTCNQAQRAREREARTIKELLQYIKTKEQK